MGDQISAIESLTEGVREGLRAQTLLGVTGSGKTFTMANIIANINRPTLVLAHNKTLAAQLCCEFREYFPENAVEYFVSYYDYYQPEAYIPGKDIYIEKDSAINNEIDKLRHSATSSLFERNDVIVVSSVSCIYTLGDPVEYKNLVISLRPGMRMSENELLRKLVAVQYERNDIDLKRNKFRVRGDTVDIFPSSSTDKVIRVEFFGDEIDRISEINAVSSSVLSHLSHCAIYPATHYATTAEKREKAIEEIEDELADRVKFFESQGKLLEAQRIAERVNYDMEMVREIGYCSGIENYSRFFSGKAPGSQPYTLLDFFPDDFLMFIDESHVTIPQVRAMSAGDRARKETLVEYGFRLPSAFDNRPLRFEEFEKKLNQVIFVSATPAEYEMKHSQRVAEQLIRPTGLVDPEVIVRPIEGQIDDLITELRARVEKNERSLVITLTKKMAEDLTDYLAQRGIRVKYMHHSIDALERTEILRDLRAGEFDVLVGINLLREGLDLPEVSLVAILDADKEGFLRSERSLIQIIGRAARNVDGKVIMYADIMTDSIRNAVDETNRRREYQLRYNKEHGITPKSIKKDINALQSITSMLKESGEGEKPKKMPEKDKKQLIAALTEEMQSAAKRLDFEFAAAIRDKIKSLQGIK